MLHWAFAAAIIVAWLYANLSPVYGHDHWISRQKLTDPITGQWCCNEFDTFEETENVEAVPGGYRIKSTGEFIPNERVIWKSPGGWWRSRNLGDGTTRCLIGPPPAT